MATKRPTVRNLVIVSDTHSGCRLSLCPPSGVRLDDGGFYHPSEFQTKMWAYWREFWDTWVPQVTRGEPYHLIHNGDALEGVHHNATTQISHNIEDQLRIAEDVLSPEIRGAKPLAGPTTTFAARKRTSGNRRATKKTSPDDWARSRIRPGNTPATTSGSAAAMSSSI
jgi:hypothetical protein